QAALVAPIFFCTKQAVAGNSMSGVAVATRIRSISLGEIFACSMAFSAALAPMSLVRSEEHTSELQSRVDLVCRLLLEKKKINPVICCKIPNKTRNANCSDTQLTRPQGRRSGSTTTHTTLGNLYNPTESQQ